MTLANPSWNWDLIIFIYTIFVMVCGALIGFMARTSTHKSEMFNELEKSEELRAIINGLLNEFDEIDKVIAKVS